MNDFGEPSGAGWSSVPSTTVTLEPVPLQAQPNDYIKAAWTDRPYGNVKEATITSTREGEILHVRIEWAAAGDSKEFPDAAAVVFPCDGDSDAATLGSSEHPVDLWYWRSVLPGGEILRSSGPGVVRKTGVVTAVPAKNDGRWSVVFTGAAPEDPRIAFAIWDGSNEERAGIGSVTSEWLRIEKGRGA